MAGCDPAGKRTGMPKQNSSNQQKTTNAAKTGSASGAASAPSQPEPRPTSAPAASSSSVASRKRAKSRPQAPQVGGTAIPGAKSTLPKQVPDAPSNSQQEQAESYNRTMRRRMQQIGTGPYAEPKKVKAGEKRRARQNERLEESRQILRKAAPGGIKLGRRNTLFFIGTVALVVLIIVVFVLLRYFHVI